MESDKLKFLESDFPKLLRTLAPDKPAEWGVMNLQQMIEHMSESIAQSYGKIKYPLATAPELLPKVKEFMMSDKPFRPNTKNVLLSEVPPPPKRTNAAEAIEELEEEIRSFISYYAENKNAIVQNPIFGGLNFNEWVHLLHKHAVHHLKQFGILV
jgi:hypothetical protein